MKGEPHSLYVDGKTNNVKLSVFQEQNKQIKKSPSKWRVWVFWCGVLTSSWTHTFFIILFKSLHTHPWGKTLYGKTRNCLFVAFFLHCANSRRWLKEDIHYSSAVMQRIGTPLQLQPGPLCGWGPSSFQRFPCRIFPLWAARTSSLQ